MNDKLRYLNDLGSKIEVWGQIEKACQKDINDILDLLENDEAAQFLRRALIRSAWGYIEGNVWGLQSCINVARAHFPDKKIMEINDKNGALNNTKLVLTIGSAIFDPKWKPDFSGSGYRSLSKSIKIRHRLMHPKNGADLDISNEEFHCLKNGLIWFIETVTDLQKEAVKRGKS